MTVGWVVANPGQERWKNVKGGPMGKIVFDDNLAYLENDSSRSVFSLIYIDPPFNTGRRQSRTRLRTIADPTGDRVGFQGKRYRTERIGTTSFDDRFENYIEFLRPRMEAARKFLASNGSLFLHVDCHEVHYCKVMLDEVFGRDSFMNEIIWAYDYGARTKRRWSAKHDNILWYANDPDNYLFNYDAIDRIPYMAPGLVGPEKAARGKTPTDVWWHTIVSPNAKEKTGYATQKPLGILERIVRVHSNPGDQVLDFFAGSGSFGEAAARHGRNFVLVDNNPEAIEVMLKRLGEYAPEVVRRGALAGEQAPEPPEPNGPKRPSARTDPPEPSPPARTRFARTRSAAPPDRRENPVNQAQDRIMTPMQALFRAAADIPEETIHAVEGAVEQGELSVKVLMVADNFVTLWIRRGKGLIDPVHQHDDHESVATLVSGRLKMWIGDEEFVAGPGDVWRHPPGVPHYSEALEECVQIEIKSPARKTWT